MKRTAILLILITIVSSIFGFARDITLSYFYGASNISDAYLISITIPMVIFGFVGIGISTGYIPMYSKLEQDYGVDEANRYTNNLINNLLLIYTVIVILGFLFTNQIVKVFASGFKGETLTLAVQFTKISLLGIYFTGTLYIFKGFLQLKGNYTIPALVGFPLNLITIISIFLSANTNIIVLSIGSLIANGTQLLLLIPFMKKKEYRYKLIFNIKDKHIRNMVYIALPLILGLSVNQISALVDRTIASMIAIGGISALSYANRLIGFVQGIFVLSITTAMYPIISKMAAEGNINGLKKSVAESVNGINLFLLPVTVGAMIFTKPVVKLLFGRGAFDYNAIAMTSDVLFFYSIGLVGFGLREVLSRAFYSLQDTKTPMINAVIAMVVDIILNIVLSKFLGIGGLSLSTSISAIFCTILLFISLRKKIGSFGIKSIGTSFIKILCASLFMGLIAKFIYNLLINNISTNLCLLVAVGIGILLYLVVIYFMKIEDVDIIVNTLKQKIKKAAT